MSYKLIDANSIAFNSNGFITAENIEKMPCIYADLPNGMDGEHYILEQEPCEDAISRQAVLDCLTVTKLKKFDFVLHAREEIKKLPPVTPQLKIGHWIAVYQGDEIINYRCSECEFGNTFGKNTDGMYYCPKCGARMESGEEITAEEAKKLGECFEEGFRKGLSNDRK